MNKLFSIILLLALCSAAQDTVDVSIKGFSDTNKGGAQQDRMEAELDAKRQACEKAGIEISSETKVENFQTTYDYVEGKAQGVLLPGFTIIDVGYLEDGTYSVVLVGKVLKKSGKAKGKAEFTLALWLEDKGKKIKDTEALLDKVYAWLDIIKGELQFGAYALDDLEDNLVSVLRNDSLYMKRRRYYAFTYSVPQGEFVYKQRTPSVSGSVTKHDFKIKMRANKHYIMHVAHNNAVYFDRPKAFDKKVKHPRDGWVFPKEFGKIK